MAANKITYDDKILYKTSDQPEIKKWTFEDANEVKDVINSHALDIDALEETAITEIFTDGITIEGEGTLASPLKTASTANTYAGTPTIDVAGFEGGKAYDLINLQAFADVLFNGFETPKLLTFDITDSDTLVEIGDTFGGSKTFNWSYENENSVADAKVLLTDETNSSVIIADADGITETLTIPNVTHTNAGDIHTYSVDTEDSRGNKLDKLEKSITWAAKKYWGSSSNETLTEVQIKALQDSNLNNILEGEYNIDAATGYLYFCVEESETVFSFGDHIPFTLIGGTVSITNDFATTKNYKIYRSYNKINSAITLNIK